MLKDGILQQVDEPKTLYSHPANLFVAGFIGSPAMNLAEANFVDGAIRLAGVPVALTDDVQEALSDTDSSFVVGVRPEHLALGSGSDVAGMNGAVTVVEELGSEAFVHVVVSHEGEDHTLVVRDRALQRPHPSVPLRRLPRRRVATGQPSPQRFAALASLRLY